MTTRRIYTDDEISRAKAIGQWITAKMRQYSGADGTVGIGSRELSDLTGLAQTSIANIMAGAYLPGRATVAFILDVLGFHKGETYDKIVALGAERSTHTDRVKAAMRRFYGDDHPMVTGLDKRPSRHSPAPTPDPWIAATTPTPTASRRRSAAVEAMIDRMADLVDVDLDDVVEWVEANGKKMSDAEKGRIMRALWEG